MDYIKIAPYYKYVTSDKIYVSNKRLHAFKLISLVLIQKHINIKFVKIKLKEQNFKNKRDNLYK